MCAPRTSCCAACAARSPPRPSAAPDDFAELLLTPGVGARTVQALAMVAEVIHGAPCRFSDPARFSLAHGGKDGHPFPVPLEVYDETIRGPEIRGRHGASSATTSGSPRSAGSMPRRAASSRWRRRRRSPITSPTTSRAARRMAAAPSSTTARRRASSRCRSPANPVPARSPTAGRPVAPAPNRPPTAHPTPAAPSSTRATRGSA